MSDGKRDPTDADIDAIMNDVDEDEDGQINAREFAKWYSKSLDIIMKRVRRDFDITDETNDGFIPVNKIRALLERLDAKPIEKAEALCRKNVKISVRGQPPHPQIEEIKREHFLDWYVRSEFMHMFVEKNRESLSSRDLVGDFMGAHDDDDDDEDNPVDLSFPEGWKERIIYIALAPLTYSMYYTLPDVRDASWKSYYILTFWARLFGSVCTPISWYGGSRLSVEL